MSAKSSLKLKMEQLFKVCLFFRATALRASRDVFILSVIDKLLIQMDRLHAIFYKN